MFRFVKKIFDKIKIKQNVVVGNNYVNKTYKELLAEFGCPRAGRGRVGFVRDHRFNDWYNKLPNEKKDTLDRAKVNDTASQRKNKETRHKTKKNNKIKPDEMGYNFCNPEDVMPKKLVEICEYLKTIDIRLIDGYEDGRTNSNISEEVVLNKIEGRFPEIINPKPRNWCDFSFYDEGGILIPVNIKITSMGPASDNVGSKKGLFYALTGLELEKDDWKSFFDGLEENKGRRLENADYYFLVVNKNDTTDIFITSLKHIKKLTPNGNNLPFQARWKDNRELVDRTYNESKNYLMGTLGESIEKTTELPKLYKEYETNNNGQD